MVLTTRVQEQFFQKTGEQGLRGVRIGQQRRAREDGNHEAAASSESRSTKVGTWTSVEHDRFLHALELFPSGPWKSLAAFIGTRTARQVMTHAQKYRRRILRRQAKIARKSRPQLDTANTTVPFVTGFPVEPLGHRLSTDILQTEIPSRFRRIPEVETLCRGVYDRLLRLHDTVAVLNTTLGTTLDTATEWWSVNMALDTNTGAAVMSNRQLRDQYVAVMRLLIALQRRKPLLERLVTSSSRLRKITRLHEKLDDISTTLGVAIDPTMRQWEAGCTQQREVFREQFSRTTDRMLVEGMKGGKKVEETIMMLYTELQSNPNGDLADIKQSVLTRIQSHAKMQDIEMFPWFISTEQLELDNDAVSTEITEIQGTYGSVKLSVWIRMVNGRAERQNVVVKTLFPETLDGTDRLFLKHLQLWYNLPEHLNILKLLGGSHVSSPPYFVCEVAKNDIVSYLHDGNHMERFWPMFIQVAEGLQFLHGNKIVHGGLKGNNILVFDDGVPKLADFGFSRSCTLSVGESSDNNAQAAQSRAVRWKPKEVLNQVGNEEPLYASDVYSLGMCMIEVFMGRIPFDYAPDDRDAMHVLKDAEVMDMVMSGKSHQRPHDVSDDVWEFISQLCAVDYTKRLTLDEAITAMRHLPPPSSTKDRLGEGGGSSGIWSQVVVADTSHSLESLFASAFDLEEVEQAKMGQLRMDTARQHPELLEDVCPSCNSSTLRDSDVCSQCVRQQRTNTSSIKRGDSEGTRIGFGLLTQADLQRLSERCTGRFVIFRSVMTRMQELLSLEAFARADCDTQVETELAVIALLDDIAESMYGGFAASSDSIREPGFDAAEWTVENLQAAVELGVVQVPHRAEYVRGIHEKLSAAVGLVVPALEQDSDWVSCWEQDCGEQAAYFQHVVSRELRKGPYHVDETVATILLQQVDFWLRRRQSLRGQELVLMEKSRDVISKLMGGGRDDEGPSESAQMRSKPRAWPAAPGMDWTIKWNDLKVGAVHESGVSDGEWLGAPVMIKRVSDPDQAHVRRAARLWSSLGHPHIVNLYGVCDREDADLLLVTEPHSPTNLAQYLQSAGHCNEVWRVSLHVALALQYLHEQFVIHGGVRPNNIFVGGDGMAKLTGFESSLTLDDIADNFVAGEQGNTSWWQAPERQSGAKPTYASDVYSLGVSLIKAVSGDIQWEKESTDGVTKYRVQGQYSTLPRPSGFSDRQWQLVEQMCCFKAEDRLTVHEVVRQLQIVAVEEADVDYEDKVPPPEAEVAHERASRSTAAVAPTIIDRMHNTQLVDPSAWLDAPPVKEIIRWLEGVHGAAGGGDGGHDSDDDSDDQGSDGGGERGSSNWKSAHDESEGPSRGSDHGHDGDEGSNWDGGEGGGSGSAGTSGGSGNDDRAGGGDTGGAGGGGIGAASGENGGIGGGDAGGDDNSGDSGDDGDIGSYGDSGGNGRSTVGGSRDEDHVLEIPWEQIFFAEGEHCGSTRFVFRHLGSWMGANVLIEGVHGSFRATGRNVWAVARLWASLRHPNIPIWFGVCRDGSRFFFVCEYTELGNLGVYLREHRSQAWQKMLDVALALHYLHARGVVHGDLSEHCLLVSADGKAKLTGFMMSSSVLDPEATIAGTDEESPTSVVHSFSNPRWTAPECLNGAAVSFASDVYSLGKCIVETVSGALPSRSTWANAERPAPFSEVEWELVLSMCCEDPTNRLTMTEVVYWLARFVAVDAVIKDTTCTSIAVIRDAIHTARGLERHEAAERRAEEDQAIQAVIIARLPGVEQEHNMKLEEDAADEHADFELDSTNPRPSPIQKSTLVTMAGEAAEAVERDLAAHANAPESCHAQQQDHDIASTTPARQLIREWRIDPQAAERRHFIRSERIAEMPLTTAPLPEWHIPPETVERVKEIKSGGFGVVHFGRWLTAAVAIKTLTAKKIYLGSFQRKVGIWHPLSHPNIVNLFGACMPEIGTETGAPFFVCDYVGGGDLNTFLKPYREVDDRDTMWRLLYEVGLGLKAVHSQGVIHGDLKCDNILVTSDGRAKLTDFGLSYRCWDSENPPRSAAVRWQSPECLRNERPTFASDVYSFGMCIIEAISGEIPWKGLNDEGAVKSHVKNGKLPMRPAAFQDRKWDPEWDAVECMCRDDQDTRWTLDLVVQVLKCFSSQATKLGAVHHLSEAESRWLSSPDRYRISRKQKPELSLDQGGGPRGAFATMISRPTKRRRSEGPGKVEYTARV